MRQKIEGVNYINPFRKRLRHRRAVAALGSAPAAVPVYLALEECEVSWCHMRSNSDWAENLKSSGGFLWRRSKKLVAWALIALAAVLRSSAAREPSALGTCCVVEPSRLLS